MQLLACFWIVLCLVVDTSTKSATSSNDETGIGDYPDSLHWKADDNLTAEQCKCENGFCKEDDTGKSVCTCPPGWGLYDSTECKKCDCGKNFNCTFKSSFMDFIYGKEKTCICEGKGKFCAGTCIKDNCLNGAICERKGNDVECRCMLGFAGKRCEQKVQCNKTGSCKNGGECSKTEENSFCRCKAGTEGPYCEVVSECANINCSTDAECVYDVQNSKAVCQCRDNSSSSFDPVDERCKLRCNTTHVCKNGGVCSQTSGDRFCRCRNGTEGDFCNIVSECLDKKCGRDAECVYEVQSKKAVCQCRDESLSFDPVDERCKMPCKESEDCRNGGWCWKTGGNSFCRCRTGTLGDFCNIVFECSNKNCGKDAECVYEVQSERAVCQCRDDSLSFDPDDKRCKNGCLPNPCLNDGICNATKEKVTCHCKDRFRGADCSIDVCSPNPCQNGGICNASKGEVKCQCKDRFRGSDCSVDVCSPNPCLNGGVCNATREEVICQCRDRFRGADCSIEMPLLSIRTSVRTSSTTPNSTILSTYHPTSSPSDHSLNFTVGTERTLPFTTLIPTTGVDPCTENPCQNGGACVVVGNRPKCLCKKPYLGNLCETDPCDWNPCKNGGVCKIENETFGCYCKRPFTGKLCESQANLCDWNPCKNGGVCKKENDTFKCYCKEPFVGEFCESRTKIGTYVITLDAVSVFLAIALVFAICGLCQRYRAGRSS